MRGKKIAEGDLDVILALQIQIARAGERERLSWWRVDATDIDGGGDFFTRLVGSASGLCAVEAAMAGAAAFEAGRIEEAGIRHGVVSLFHPDFSLKVQLQERWMHFKNHPGDIPPYGPARIIGFG
ncbi:MAG: BREX-6 system BrxE protein [Desulfobacterales bacterium]|nr:BREX-6 system BrxE protein [Desulfobacterales bacterium]